MEHKVRPHEHAMIFWILRLTRRMTVGGSVHFDLESIQVRQCDYGAQGSVPVFLPYDSEGAA